MELRECEVGGRGPRGDIPAQRPRSVSAKLLRELSSVVDTSQVLESVAPAAPFAAGACRNRGNANRTLPAPPHRTLLAPPLAVTIMLEAAAPMSKLNPATVEGSGVPAPSLTNWSMRALRKENNQTIMTEVRAAMPIMPAGIATGPPVIDQPKIAFLNLAGASCATIAGQDRAVIGELFGRNVQVTTVPIHCDVLFLYCSFEPSGKIVGQQGSVRSLIRGCQARVAVVASQVPSHFLSNREFNAALIKGNNPPVNRVITLNRNGDNFGRFFKSLFEMMWTRVPMPMAWHQLAPQGPSQQRENVPGTICLMEAGQIAFATGAVNRF
jgi:hypothetical protein